MSLGYTGRKGTNKNVDNQLLSLIFLEFAIILTLIPFVDE